MLGKRADEQVERLHVAVVYLFELTKLLFVVRQVAKAPNRLQQELTPKLVIARHAVLSGAQNIDGPEVDQRISRHAQFLHELWIVVQHERARVLRPEGVEQIGHANPFGERGGACLAGRRQRRPFDRRVVPVAPQIERLRQQRVQPIDLDELLCQAEGRAVFLDWIAHDTAELWITDVDLGHGLALVAGAQEVRRQPIPVRVQARVHRRVGKDRRRPFDRVDLGHHRGVDEPRHVEQAGVVPVRILRLQPVADRVVLFDEQRMEHA